MSKLKTYLKIITFSSAILSGMLATSTSLSINNYLLNTFSKYQNLERAVLTLSDFKYEWPNSKDKFSALLPNDVGFREFLFMIYNKKAIPCDKKEVNGISIIITGTYIEIGGLDATPQYLLGVWTRAPAFIAVTPMYLNDTQTWIQEEKQNDLHRFAFYTVILAIICDFLSDFVQIIKRHIHNIKSKLLSYHSFKK